MTEKFIRSTRERWKREIKHAPYDQLKWLLCDFYISVRNALWFHSWSTQQGVSWSQLHYSSKCSSSWNVLDCEHNMSTEKLNFGTLHKLYKHCTALTKLWMERGISNLDLLSETVRWRTGVTLTAGSQHRRFSLQWSKQKECALYEATTVFPVPTLTHMV